MHAECKPTMLPLCILCPCRPTLLSPNYFMDLCVDQQKIPRVEQDNLQLRVFPETFFRYKKYLTKKKFRKNVMYLLFIKTANTGFVFAKKK
jgi:hypothetical protein